METVAERGSRLGDRWAGLGCAARLLLAQELRYARATMLRFMPALAAFAVALSGCIKSVPYPYTAQPSRISDPAAEVVALIQANTVPSCVVTPKLSEKTLVINYVCTQSVGNVVARLDRVDAIGLERMGDWYRVLVHHRDGLPDFAWSSKNLEDMQRLADALTALSAAATTR